MNTTLYIRWIRYYAYDEYDIIHTYVMEAYALKGENLSIRIYNKKLILYNL